MDHYGQGQHAGLLGLAILAGVGVVAYMWGRHEGLEQCPCDVTGTVTGTYDISVAPGATGGSPVPLPPGTFLPVPGSF